MPRRATKLSAAASRQIPTKYVRGTGNGSQFGTSCENSRAWVKCSPEKVASAAAMNTGPSARILDCPRLPGSQRSPRYMARPAPKALNPSADGQTTSGDRLHLDQRDQLAPNWPSGL